MYRYVGAGNKGDSPSQRRNNRIRTAVMLLLLVALIGVIILTWGSIGSAILTLALLLAAGYMLVLKIMENRDPDDFRWEM